MLIKYYADISVDDFDRVFNWMFYNKYRKSFGRNLMRMYAFKGLPTLSEDEIEDLYSNAYLQLRRVPTRIAETYSVTTIIVNCIKWQMSRMLKRKAKRQADHETYTETYVHGAGGISQTVFSYAGLHTLKPRHEAILIYHFGLADGIPKKLRETGEKFNISRQRVEQLIPRIVPFVNVDLIIEDKHEEVYI